MRGPDAMQESLFTVAKLDDFVPADHPLRAIRVLVNDALAAMNTRFREIYADTGRDSIAPEKLIRALLLQVFYSIRSERQLCEQLRYNLLSRRIATGCWCIRSWKTSLPRCCGWPIAVSCCPRNTSRSTAR
jgi:transposase